MIEIRVHGVSGTSPGVMLAGPVERVPDIGADVWRRSDRDDGLRAVRWSNLTSGSPVTAWWLALVPYMLLNLAGWALPPMGEWRHRAGAVVIRVAGLILTMIFSIVTAIGFIGVGGYQVLRPLVGTTASLTLGVVASVVVVLGLWLVASNVGVSVEADRPYLRSFHVAVAIWSVWWTLVAAVNEALGGTVLALGGVGRAWAIPASAAVALAVTGLVRAAEPFARPIGTLFVAGAAALLLIDLVALVGFDVSGVSSPDELLRIDDPLSNIARWFAASAVVAMLLGVSRRHRDAAPTIGLLIALAGSSGASVGAALIWTSAKATGATPPAGIPVIAQAFLTGTSLVLVILALVVVRAATPDSPLLRAVYLTVVRARDGVLPVLVAVPVVTATILVLTVAGLKTDGTAPAAFAPVAAVSATLTAALLCAGLVRAGLRKPAAGVAAVGVLGWLASLTGWFTFTGVSVTITLVIPLALVVTWIRGGLGDREQRRMLAIPWDVGSFFPRRFHPFAPPSYRDRAVADLADVITELRADGSAVILGAHSQGTVIAATVVDEMEDRAQIGLFTYGSPLGSLYARFFPRYFTPAFFERLSIGASGGWINMWRPTDPIAGAVPFGADNREIEDVHVRGHASYWLADEPGFAQAIADVAGRL